jgi:hypothetical protein
VGAFLGALAGRAADHGGAVVSGAQPVVRHSLAQIGADRIGHLLHEARVVGDFFHSKHRTLLFPWGQDRANRRPAP